MQKPLLKNEHELFFPLFDQIIQFAASDKSLFMWNPPGLPLGRKAKLIYHLIQFVPPANPSGTLASPFQAERKGGGTSGQRETPGNSPKAQVSEQLATKRHGDTARPRAPIFLHLLLPSAHYIVTTPAEDSRLLGAQRVPDHTLCRRHHGAHLTARQLSFRDVEENI